MECNRSNMPSCGSESMSNKMDELFTESFDKQLKMSEGIGALKIINAIQPVFRQSNGDIHITYDEWTNFMTPYTELPK
ncbi:MAG TPA: hypothetical protein VMQ58_02450 [Candidatus Saccharimonadales bacterium]|nr:hypothetical protein [Candidatus Saccharimonadales bacterium]